MMIQEKIAGGKMICVDADVSEGMIKKIRICGDFFLHPEELIMTIEKELIGTEVNSVSAKVAHILKKNDAQLIGATPDDIERLVIKAVS